MIKRIIFILCCVLSLHAQKAYSQVTIGSSVEPEQASLLSIKEFAPATPGGETVKNGGIIYPRVKLQNKNELYPFFPSTASGTDDYEKVQKPNHKGLTVYNLNEDANQDLSEGVYYWDGTKWTFVQKGTEQGVFTIDNCSSDVQVNGVYSNNEALGSQNFLKLKLNVTKAGSYVITAKPDPDNGYYFSTQGVFYTTGSMEIIVPGVGTPKTYTQSGSLGDNVKIYLNNAETESCSVNVKISDSSVKPNFLMVCNSINVKGIYKKGVALDNSNYITMTINVAAGAQGATYLVETDVIEGISFSATGILPSAGPMTITLYGTGTPITTNVKTFTISTNSALSPTSTCSAVVTPVIAAKKIIAAGDTTYGLTSGGTDGCGAMIADQMNYGSNENSIVKYEGFATVETAASLANLATWTGANGSQPYDVILITYNLTPTAAQRAQLVDYVNKGGVFIYLDQNVTAANAQVVADIFEETMVSNPVSIANTCNQVIKMNPGVNDEISNGVFGDIRNGQWGEDFANSCGLTWSPRGAIIYAGATNAATGLQSTSGATVSMLRHPNKNFFWCGDSGLIHGGTGTSNTTTPFNVGSRTFGGITYPKYPVDKANYGSQAAAQRLPVCNSTIFANVMAWALNQAEMNGINSGK